MIVTGLTLFILMIFAGYIFISLFLHYGLSKKPPKLEHAPSVSILIAARNEERYISSCLESMACLEYPASLLEIMILNDHSTDATPAIALAYAAQKNNFKVLDIPTSRDGLKGKMHALAQGIEKSSGELILVTDADCRVPPSWASDFVRYLTADTGLAGSMTLLRSAFDRPTLFSSLQNLDWIFLQGVAGGTTAVGLPVTVLGNNFGFRRQVYEDAGGFQSIGFSLVEDLELMKAIHKKGWRIAYPLSPSTAIESEPVLSWREFYRQRLRWVKGGRGTSAWGYILMTVSFLAHAGMCTPLLTGVHDSLVLGAIASVLLADFVFLLRLLKRFRLVKLILYFPLFEFFYLLYTLFFAVLFLLPVKVIWKDRSY
jgi:cellulose synthase/poly-beta-1,6-N-acetylglucosamine synthase-like glycosyltransferase